ncbi:hypothetical protein DH2020_045767 [Rehmannia glutinosa]|uniref:Zinc finger BED domain-containing protein RICESLEEPER 2-like n=1 Tax=Rehmannia glutinosa TaxID=99300 RepID=A0ABR0UDV4_REHGL
MVFDSDSARHQLVQAHPFSSQTSLKSFSSSSMVSSRVRLLQEHGSLSRKKIVIEEDVKVMPKIMRSKVDDGREKAKCNYCSTLIAINSQGSTTQFHRRLESCPVRLAANKNQRLLCTQPLGPTDFGGGSGGTITTYKYDKERVREYLAKMVIVHEYPFRMLEHDFFVMFCKILNPRFEKMSRVTLRSDCIKLYVVEKNKLRVTFEGVERFSLTSDLWTSNRILDIYVLHVIILIEWKLQKRILNFCAMAPPHTWGCYFDCIFQCLIDWGIENKISTITLDNASSNDAAIRDVIENIRESVKYLKMSPSRLHRFSKVVKQLQLPTSKGLILDVPTRWNSTYAMLESALVFRDVFPRYKERDPNYQWLPSSTDWDMALEVFFDPRYKMKLVEFCYSKIYPVSKAHEEIELVFFSLHELYGEYVVTSTSNSTKLNDQSKVNSFVTNVDSGKTKSKSKGRTKFELWAQELDTIIPSKSEMAIYLEEGLYVCKDELDTDFNALDWWKANTLKFRVLANMTRDILSIPITTVASESAFSAGGEFLISIEVLRSLIWFKL